MKKTFNKIKTWLAALWITIISFFSKVMGQFGQFWQEDEIYDIYWNPSRIELLYWVSSPIQEPPALINTIIKLAKWPLIAIAFIVWIISLIKIRKIEDKTQKKKKIKRVVITISILLVLIVACFVLPLLLKKY